MNILVLCTYPIKNPRHGGQLRTRNIVDTYQAAGHVVEIVGVLGSEHYDSEDGFFPYPGSGVLATVIPNPFLMEDFAIGRLFASDAQYYERLASKIRTRPDVIHVEQPWLVAFARSYIASQLLDAKLIYGSQNTEWRLKQEIASSYIDENTAGQYAELIKEVELEALSGADAIVCVSESDADWLKSKTKKQIVLAPNGVKAWQTTETGFHEAAAITKNYRYALYCASAHPPNMTGFFDIFDGGFGSLKPDEKLVVAGGAGWAIAGDVRVHQSPKLAEKVVVAGIVSQPCLEGLLDEANCIVLPLTHGGGTNLKTAEALWARKHIVATTIAMRGFERFIGSPGVHIADEPDAFKRALRDAMGADPVKLTPTEIDQRRYVLWESCLEPLVTLINNLHNEAKA